VGVRPWLALATAGFVALAYSARAADVPYVSGGIGADEREQLRAKEGEYNLKIVTAETSGDYLARVRVVIESAANERLVDTTLDGPILLARVPPGSYTITATAGSESHTQTVTVPAAALQQVDFRWGPATTK
jgi:hypothetical protein